MYDLPPENRQSSANNRKKISSDELIALFLAFITIGGLLFWILGRKGDGWKLDLLSDTGTNNIPSLSSSGKITSDSDRTIAESLNIDSNIDANPTIDNNNNNARSGQLDRNSSLAIDPLNFPTINNTNNGSDRSFFDNLYQSADAASKESQDRTTKNNKNAKNSGQLFSDVPDNYWAKPFIETLAKQKTIEGFPDGSFQPDKPITRSELAAIINRAFPSSNNTNDLAFKDVPTGSEMSKSIDGAIDSGFMKGYPDGLFQPDKPLTRLQALVALATGLQLQTLQNPADVLTIYQDNKNIPQWARQQIAAATDKGLVVSYPNINNLNGDRIATRGEIAVAIYQALVISGKMPPIDSEYIINQGKK